MSPIMIQMPVIIYSLFLTYSMVLPKIKYVHATAKRIDYILAN